MTFDGDVLGVETIVVRRQGQGVHTDPYGNPAPTPPTRHEVGGCSVQPFLSRNTSEDLTPERDVVITRWRLFMPAGADVQPADVIEWRGLDLQVDGDVMPWVGDAYDEDAYDETYLKRWRG